ncbi:MAG: peptide MFS transporter [Gammaproteobacteria bacterium]|nr:peptide MFS transporter [Gammaproteobacteria bacterium]NNF50658.1 peptide MFS transporter [Woeseiaceae bacterium]MBT8095366.1 peptide MFS transporter [Gammaproteobacteria bacterium]MBT8104111.1 peptide MFS transporter [Gammaproteobacteria bacterium]NNK24126.1 peptide MFS transporter [Woeseiaceae bacterium]
MTDPTAPTAPIHDTGAFGHPRGLMTLFFTELWERFSYYGMRAFLILYMTDTARHGLGLGTEISGAIYGLYTFGVYALALPGGWIADRIIGQRQAVLIGGAIIALGHFTLAAPIIVPGSEYWSFFLGLIFVVIGTGLLKPNVSAIVGDLYTGDTPERRDAGFSIYYMGINIGAFLGPLVCSFFAEKVDWHLGFSLAGIGMIFGLIQYVRGTPSLQGAGELNEEALSRVAEGRKQLAYALIGAAIGGGTLYALVSTGMVAMTVVGFAQATGLIVVIVAVLYFGSVMTFACRDKVERHHIFVIFLLFLGAAMFWSGFEQAGSSMNIFARDLTDRVIFGWEVPTGWLQSINPIFIILLAPVMGMLWVKLGARSPSIPVKFGMGLALLGVGFLVLAWGSLYVPEGAASNPALGVGMTWLTVTYFFHTVGELALSPVGLSSVTKLAPHRLVGQMMGTWFMGAALGNLVAGLIAGRIETLPPEQLFTVVASIVIGAGLLFLLFSPLINRLTHGVK